LDANYHSISAIPDESSGFDSSEKAQQFHRCILLSKHGAVKLFS